MLTLCGSSVTQSRSAEQVGRAGRRKMTAREWAPRVTVSATEEWARHPTVRNRIRNRPGVSPIAGRLCPRAEHEGQSVCVCVRGCGGGGGWGVGHNFSSLGNPCLRRTLLRQHAQLLLLRPQPPPAPTAQPPPAPTAPAVWPRALHLPSPVKPSLPQPVPPPSPSAARPAQKGHHVTRNSEIAYKLIQNTQAEMLIWSPAGRIGFQRLVHANRAQAHLRTWSASCCRFSSESAIFCTSRALAPAALASFSSRRPSAPPIALPSPPPPCQDQLHATKCALWQDLKLQPGKT